jgi:hypothetical protein
MSINTKHWITGAASAIVVGIAGGVFGAFLSVAHPGLSSSIAPIAPVPLTIEPGSSIVLVNTGEAQASVKVDRNGLILLSVTSGIGENQIALGVLGDSKLEVGVFDSAGEAKVGMEVPMRNSGHVHILLLDKKELHPGTRNSVQS